MPAYPARALVLRKTRLGEADVIVTLLAEDGHQVRAVAKGARKTVSRFRGRVEPYVVGRFLLHTGRSLDVVTEAEMETLHEGIREDYDRGVHAAVAADFLEKASLEGDVEPRLFQLALATLDVVETADAGDLLALTDAFLVKGMAMIGYRPELDGCVACGAEAAGGGFFGPEAGGLLCGACSEEEVSAIGVSPDLAAVLAALLRARMSDVAALRVPPRLAREAFETVVAFVRHHVAARLRSLEFLDAHLASAR